jgi:hypothetical protein
VDAKLLRHVTDAHSLTLRSRNDNWAVRERGNDHWFLVELKANVAMIRIQPYAVMMRIEVFDVGHQFADVGAVLQSIKANSASQQVEQRALS